MSDTTEAAVKVAVIGTGSYLPERVLTNAELEARIETTDEWIRSRTGIGERHLARPDETTSDMAAEAARRALAQAGIKAGDVDLIIVATVTPDMPFPNTACFVQHKIGAAHASCFDIEAACSGFLYALETARCFILAGQVKTALVIGAEKLSCVTDWEDRATCVLFGDGAGAVVLRAVPGDHGILETVMGSDGSLTDLLNIPGGGSKYPTSPETLAQRLHFMKMEGKKVFVHAVRCMCDAGAQALKKAGLTAADVKWVIPHQANLRIVQAIADRFGVPIEQFCNNLERVGNTSGASVPLALDEAVRDGRIKRGDIVVLVVFGGGFTWGATVIRW